MLCQQAFWIPIQRLGRCKLHFCEIGIARRLYLAAKLTSFAIEGTYTALRRRYPEASALEIDLLFVEPQHGLALANRLRAARMPQAGEQD